MNDCLFCKIIAGDIPCTKVYEDDTVLAFLDIHPVNIGHTLVIPKTHYVNIYDIPEELVAKMAIASKRVAVSIKKGISPDGINIVSNNDKGAHPQILHSHMHIIPRWLNDGFKEWIGARGYNEGEMTEVAEKIKISL